MNIRDFVFEPKCSDATLELAKKWLKENRSGFTNMCSFAVFAGEKHRSHIGAPCHYGMQTPDADPAFGSRDCISAEIAINRITELWPKHTSIELYEPFLKWFLYDSMFGRFILNRDDYEFCRDYGIVVSSDIPSPFLQNILILSRSFYECAPAAFAFFNRLLEEGYSGDVAYPFAMNTKISYWEVSNGRLPPPDVGLKHQVFSTPSHRAWGLWSNVTELKNFLSGELGNAFTQDPKHYYRCYQTIYGGSKYCTTGAAGHLYNSLHQNSEFAKKYGEFKNGKPSMAEVLNPFKKVSPQVPAQSFNYEELSSFVLPFLKKQGVLNVNENRV